MSARSKGGRPRFKVTPALQRKVVELVSCGMSEEHIATEIGCSRSTLLRSFRHELDTGHAKGKAQAIALLWRAARKLNVAAIKKLVDETNAASAEKSFGAEPRSVPKSQRLGKKEEAAIAATTAGEGTDWGEDLQASVAGLN